MENQGDDQRVGKRESRTQPETGREGSCVTITFQRGRWGRSIRADVRPRPDKPCMLKRHFRGCLRQVIGYLDVLASRDPDRFVWCSWKDIVQHARKWKKGGATYKRSMVFRCLEMLTALGIIEKASRVRNGCWRTGFIVKDHDVMVRKPKGDHACVLVTEVGMQLESEVERELHQSGTQKAASGTESGLVLAPKRNDEWNGKHLPPSMNMRENDRGSEFVSEVLVPLSLSALSKEPCKDSPVEPEKGYNAKPANLEAYNSTTVSSPSDHDELPHYGNTDSFDFESAGETIGQRFRFGCLGPEEICERVSMGEFDSAYLKHYEYVSRLAEFCQYAVTDLADEPFRGPRSCARVMGHAMELLRTLHGLDVPRGWVPVMKRLRGLPVETNRREEYRPPPAEEVLTSPLHSVLASFYLDQIHPALAQEPTLEGLLIETAKEVWPGSFVDGLDCVDLVIAKLEKQNAHVPDPLKLIRKDLERRLADLKLAGIDASSQHTRRKRVLEDQNVRKLDKVILSSD
jgi:hypothetical protein